MPYLAPQNAPGVTYTPHSAPPVSHADGLCASVAASAAASLPSRQEQAAYLALFRQIGFPLSACLGTLLPAINGADYAYDASPTLLHAIYAFVAPSHAAKTHAQAARALLALHAASDEEDKVGVGGDDSLSSSTSSSGVAMAYALLAMHSLQLGQARQATLDAALAWRTLRSASPARLCAAVAVVEGLASLYAGARPTSHIPACVAGRGEYCADELAGAFAQLAQATRLATLVDVDTWYSGLPASLAYTGDHVAALAEAGAQGSSSTSSTSDNHSSNSSGSLPPADQLAWASMHLLAARVQLCSPQLSASAIGRGRVATLQAALDVNPTWSRAVSVFLLLARVALKRPTSALDGPARMALAVLDRPVFDHLVPRTNTNATAATTANTTTSSSIDTRATAIRATTTAGVLPCERPTSPSTPSLAAVMVAEASQQGPPPPPPLLPPQPHPGRAVSDLLAALPRRRAKILPTPGVHPTAKTYASYTRP